MPPEDGLSTLAAVISSLSTRATASLHLPVPAAVAAGKLLWDALLKNGAPRCGNSLYSDFAFSQLTTVIEIKAGAKSIETENAAVGRQALRTLGGGSELESGSRTHPGVHALGGAAWEASVLSSIIAIVVGVVGCEVSADQPLMEVRDLNLIES